MGKEGRESEGIEGARKRDRKEMRQKIRETRRKLGRIGRQEGR